MEAIYNNGLVQYHQTVNCVDVANIDVQAYVTPLREFPYDMTIDSLCSGLCHAFKALRMRTKILFVKKDSSVMVSMWRRGSKDPFISQPIWGLWRLCQPE